MTTINMIEQKLNEILELLRPKGVQPVQEEWEDVTEHCLGISCSNIPEFIGGIQTSVCALFQQTPANSGDYRLTRIDGMHNGPAFIIERRKS